MTEMHARGRRATHRRAVRSILAWLIGLAIVAPLLAIANTAFMSQREFVSSSGGLAITTRPTVTNIVNAWNTSDLVRAVPNSLLAAGVGVTIAVSVSSLAAYWFIQYNGVLNRVVWLVFIACLAIPVTAYIIPLYVLITQIGIGGSLFTLGAVYGAYLTPFSTYLIYNYFCDIPRDLIESASVDGASSLQRLVRIVLPLSKPILATTMGFGLVITLGDLTMSLILIGTSARRTMVVAVISLQQLFAQNYPEIVAGGFILIVLTGALFFGLQRQIRAGITAGAVK